MVQEDSRRLKKDPERSRRFNKAQEGSRRIKQVEEGSIKKDAIRLYMVLKVSRRFKKV